MTEALTQETFQEWLKRAHVGGTLVYATGHCRVACEPEGTPTKKLYNLIYKKYQAGLLHLLQRRTPETTEYLAVRSSQPIGDKSSFAKRIAHHEQKETA